MAGHQIDLSIVIPAFNEARKVAADIQAADAYLRDRGLKGEIVVVDDGSRDETAQVAEGLGRAVSGLQVIRYQPNRGKGYALRAGMAATRGDVVMFADAGLCVPYEDADTGRALLEGGVDVAIGSRRATGSEIVQAQPFHRRAGSRVFSLIIRTCFPLASDLHDTQCGFKVFRGDVGRALYARCLVDQMMIDIDMLCRAERLGYRVAEFPVRWSNDPDSRFRPVSGSWQNATQLARIWWDLNVSSRRRDATA